MASAPALGAGDREFESPRPDEGLGEARRRVPRERLCPRCGRLVVTGGSSLPTTRRYRQLVVTGSSSLSADWAVVMSSSAAAVTMRMGRLGFGGAPIGGLYRDVNATDALAALEEAWRCGVRYFDTAPHYGAGRSELLIGEFLAVKPRAEAVVSTKVGRLLLTDPGAGGRSCIPDGTRRSAGV